jgi:hypothetical protein
MKLLTKPKLPTSRKKIIQYIVNREKSNLKWAGRKDIICSSPKHWNYFSTKTLISLI